MSAADTLTLKHALVGQLLGDIDSLVKRLEAVPDTFHAANSALAFTVKALDESGDRYRLAVTASTDEARTELLDFIRRKSAESTAEQRLAIAEAAKQALRKEATEAVTQALRTSLATNLEEAVGKIALKLHQPLATRLLEHGITALMASVITAAAMFYLVHAR
jgi:hypothetical protein